MVEQINLATLDHAIVLSLADGVIQFRHFTIGMKKSGTRFVLSLCLSVCMCTYLIFCVKKKNNNKQTSIPRVVLTPAGPSFDLVLRRSQIAPDAVRNEALKRPRELASVRSLFFTGCTFVINTRLMVLCIEKTQKCYEQFVWRKDWSHSYAATGSQHDAGEEGARFEACQKGRRRRSGKIINHEEGKKRSICSIRRDFGEQIDNVVDDLTLCTGSQTTSVAQNRKRNHRILSNHAGKTIHTLHCAGFCKRDKLPKKKKQLVFFFFFADTA